MEDKRITKILVAVSGMSPQIITETVYGLFSDKEMPWIPDEIHLITTEKGKENADLQLLGKDGYFKRLLADYSIDQLIRFDESTIHVIQDDSGYSLPDLRTPGDNEIAANFICEVIRDLTNRPETELQVSLAGGRKTMGFYVGYALSLFGRPQDRLSHVLVSEEFESLRDFFYPTPQKSRIYTRDDRPLDPSQAKVWLANIPFVRLRSFLPKDTLCTKASFSEVVELVEMLTGNPDVRLNVESKELLIGTISIPLSARELALYVVFVRALLSGEPIIKVTKRESVPLAESYLEVYRRLKGKNSDIDQTEKALSEGMGKDYFDPTKSRLNTQFARALGRQGANRYQIQSGAKGSGEFFLSLDTDYVYLEE